MIVVRPRTLTLTSNKFLVLAVFFFLSEIAMTRNVTSNFVTALHIRCQTMSISAEIAIREKS